MSLPDSLSCSICLLSLNPDPVKPKCGHTFHNACLKKWITEGTPNCPICRGKIAINKKLPADHSSAIKVRALEEKQLAALTADWRNKPNRGLTYNRIAEQLAKIQENTPEEEVLPRLRRLVARCLKEGATLTFQEGLTGRTIVHQALSRDDALLFEALAHFVDAHSAWDIEDHSGRLPEDHLGSSDSACRTIAAKHFTHKATNINGGLTYRQLMQRLDHKERERRTSLSDREKILLLRALLTETLRNGAKPTYPVDHHGNTILHQALEQHNIPLLQALVLTPPFNSLLDHPNRKGEPPRQMLLHVSEELQEAICEAVGNPKRFKQETVDAREVYAH